MGPFYAQGIIERPMSNIYNLTDTWNAAGVTFTAIKMNVTDTASAAGSRLIDLQMAGSSRLYLDKSGALFVSGPITASSLSLSSALALSSGGTGATTAAGARVSILPALATNGGKVLAVNAGATDVEWITLTGGGSVSSVNAAGGSTGLTFSGGPITGSGTLTLGGVLALASGGTGAITPAAARVNLLPVYTSNAGKVLTVNALGTDVEWSVPATGASAGANTDITSLGGITGGISSPDFIQFDTTAVVTPAAGRLYFNDGEGGLSYVLKGGNVVQEVGQSQQVLVYNGTGATISKGQVVYSNGAQGQRPTVALALATADSTSARTLGIAAENIANGAEGWVTTLGIVENINTSAFTAGAQLYLSGTVAGGLTSTKPVAPIHMVYVARCIKSHASAGRMFVTVQNGYEMDELHDVSAVSPANNDGLFYNTATSLWEKKSIVTALGYTPYNATNPAGYTTNIGTVTSVTGSGTVSGLTLSGTGTGAVTLTLGGTLSLTSANVTSGLGYTPATRSTNAFPNSPNASLGSLDLRTMSNPTAGLGYAGGGRFRFSSLNDDNLTPYADVIDLSTYTDASGGGFNSLYFGKNSQLIQHKYAAAAATSWTVKTLAYTDSNITGSAATLTTARTINGTSFNGSANITTASWGTARTITIGSTGKSVDGSANVSWTVGEIGATTVGANLFGLANPSAVTFLRVNADNTVSTLDAAAFRTAIGAGTGSGSGTVTSVSVVSANGFAGTVATNSTTPAITLTTSISGLLKGNGTAISAATAGTDYVIPSGSITGSSGFVAGGDLGTGDLNSIISTASSGDLRYHRYQSAATNKPIAIDNANGVLTLVSHPTGGTGVYGKQIAFANSDDLYIRSFSNGGFATWRKIWHDGNLTNLNQLTNGPGYTTNAGTVTSVSVVSANGFTGTVATNSTTPAITLTTSISGLLKGNGTAISAAVAGTDYVIPGGSITGNAGTATTLQTARLINGVSFNGSADITVADSTKLPLAGGTLTGALTTASASGLGNGNPRSLITGYSGGNYGQTGYGIAFTTTSDTHNYAINDAVSLWEAFDGLRVRAAAAGTVGTAITWTTVLDARRTMTSMTFKGNAVLDASNFSSYALPLTGGTMTGAISFAAGQTWPTFNQSTTGSAATLTTARTLTIGSTGKTFNGSANVSWSHAELGTVRNFGVVEVQGVAGSNVSCTTAQFITWLTNLGAFAQTASVMKCSWSYAGNNDISDTGFGALDTAGCVIETFTDGGQIIVRVTSPSTGTGAGGIHEYIDHGPSYSPGWRRVYTSALNGNITGTASNITGTYGGTLTSSQVTTALGFTPYNATNPSGYTSNAGTVTSVSVASANGFAGTVATNSTTPAITISTSISGLLKGNGTAISAATAGTDYVIPSGSITGSAGSLSANSNYMVDRGTVLQANVDTATLNGFYQQTNPSDSQGILVFNSGGSLGPLQMTFTYGGLLQFRNKTDSTTWTAWKTALTSANFSSYAPTLTGGGASGTWGINVTGTAGSISGFNNPTTAATANTIVYRDGNGDDTRRYGFAEYFNMSHGASGSTTDTIFYSSGDNYIRKNNATGFRASLNVPTRTGGDASGTWGINVTGSAASATTLSALGNYVWSQSTLPNSYPLGIQSSFVGPGGTEGSWQQYGSVMTMRTYSGGGGSLQLYVPYGPNNGGTGLQVRFGNYDVSTGNSWTSWKTLLASDNFNSYAPSLTGGGASGTWGINITGNAATVASLGVHAGTNNEANKIVRTDVNGYIQAGYIHSASGNEANNSSPPRVWGTNGGDSYLRTYLTSALSVSYAATAGSADQIDGVGFRNTGSNASTNADTIESNGITYYGAGVPSWPGSVTDGALYSQAYSASWQHQIAGDYRTGQIALRGKNNGTWQAWRTVLDTTNFSSYAVPLSGGTMTGNLIIGSGGGINSSSLNASGNNGYGGTNYHGFLSVRNTGASNPNKHFRISPTGAFEIVNSAYTIVLFTFDDAGNFTAANNVTAYSDARLKKDIVKIDNAIEKVSKLNGYTYTRTDTEARQMGVIAQEVMEVIPEVVIGSEETNYSVAYGNMVALLIEAVKEQQVQINELKDKLSRALGE